MQVIFDLFQRGYHRTVLPYRNQQIKKEKKRNEEYNGTSPIYRKLPLDTPAGFLASPCWETYKRFCRYFQVKWNLHITKAKGLAKFGCCNHGNELSQYRGSFNPFYYTGVEKMVPISDEYVCKVFFRLNIVKIPISYYLL